MTTINKDAILNEALRIAGVYRRHIPYTLNQIEYGILEESLRRVSIPNLPSGGAPTRSLSQSELMLLHATVHNLVNDELNKQKTVKIAVSDEDILRDIKRMNEEIRKKKEGEKKQQDECIAKEPMLEDYFGGRLCTRRGNVSYEKLQEQITTDDILRAYTEIQEYRKMVKMDIDSRVKKATDTYWSISDKQIIQEGLTSKYDGSNRYPCSDMIESYGYTDIPKYIVGSASNGDELINEESWKRKVFDNIFGPLIREQYTKWHFYATKLHERFQTPENKKHTWNAEEKLKELEEKLEEETKKRKEAEQKLSDIRRLL